MEDTKPYENVLREPPLFGEAKREFTVTVPEDYNHAHELARFIERNKKYFTLQKSPDHEYIKIDERLTDEIFERVVDKLIPGKTYTVKLFQLSFVYLRHTGAILAWMEQEGALSVGVRGLTVAWEQHREQFPMNMQMTTYCLDSEWNVPIFDERSGTGEYSYAYFPSISYRDPEWEFLCEPFDLLSDSDCFLMYYDHDKVQPKLGKDTIPFNPLLAQK